MLNTSTNTLEKKLLNSLSINLNNLFLSLHLHTHTLSLSLSLSLRPSRRNIDRYYLQMASRDGQGSGKIFEGEKRKLLFGRARVRRCPARKAR